jgi:hypothetical protein
LEVHSISRVEFFLMRVCVCVCVCVCVEGGGGVKRCQGNFSSQVADTISTAFSVVDRTIRQWNEKRQVGSVLNTL